MFFAFDPQRPCPGFIVAWLFAVPLGFLNRSRFSSRYLFYGWLGVLTLFLAVMAWLTY